MKVKKKPLSEIANELKSTHMNKSMFDYLLVSKKEDDKDLEKLF